METCSFTNKFHGKRKKIKAGFSRINLFKRLWKVFSISNGKGCDRYKNSTIRIFQIILVGFFEEMMGKNYTIVLEGNQILPTPWIKM